MPKLTRKNCTPPQGDYQLPQEKGKRAGVLTGDEEVDKQRVHENKLAYEEQPEVFRTGNDYIIENRHNSSVVLGRDYSYDKLNDTNVGMVDISCGRVGNRDPLGFVHTDGCGNRAAGDPMADAARVYISQKADIDKMFGFLGEETKTSNSRSAVGIKADAVRVISRDPAAGIKLIVQPDSTGIRSGRNSLGGKTSAAIGGVTLIGTGKSENMFGSGRKIDQMVKSEPLAAALTIMATQIQKLEIIVWDFVSAQKNFNRTVAKAADVEAFYASKGLPDPDKPVENAKTSLSVYCNVEETGGKIYKTLEEFKTSILNVTTTDESTAIWGEKISHSAPPDFASTYHKLN